MVRYDDGRLVKRNRKREDGRGKEELFELSM
jgi:hypothetical protein